MANNQLLDQYDADYYERGVETGKSCYSNYRWMPEMTMGMAMSIIDHFKIGRDQTILDYGCAKGYLVYAMRILHRNAYGYDPSEYAISQAPTEVQEFLDSNLTSLYGGDPFDLIISKDVFEHIPHTHIGPELHRLSKIGRKLFAVIPLGVKTQKCERYVIPAYESDKTHELRKPSEWWSNTFRANGWMPYGFAYSIDGIKDNWTNQFPKGNGFYSCVTTDARQHAK